jgi:hypothetical protein
LRYANTTLALPLSYWEKGLRIFASGHLFGRMYCGGEERRRLGRYKIPWILLLTRMY